MPKLNSKTYNNELILSLAWQITKIRKLNLFFRKKIRRSWYPIVQKQTYKSLILSRRIHVKVTTKTMKCFRKAGSLDNYILLTKPQDQDFTYEEYLRKLMLTKIDAPLFEVQYCTKDQDSTCFKSQTSKLLKKSIKIKPNSFSCMTST